MSNQREQADAFLAQMDQFANMMKQSIGVPVLLDQKTGVALWWDQREIKLRFVISVEKIRKFFEALSEGKLLATKCKKSGKILFPPQVDCPDDPEDEVEWVELPKEGELVTWTVIYVKPYSFGHYNDYTVGIAKLTNGVQILAWVRETDPSKLKVGQKVKIEIVKREPEGYLTYEIVPVQE
ncbi:MAG: Zn-ribbon domain-containing OB-fold protein [Desulfurococcales archaeon]|nr:Zn-ribbon domain-containing OB-fold protein [Desulfurococcales archaeon]MEB3764722.1 Zn-ribbon domain-containing OB-fold protein [Desulfurococcales archaeon]MEB3788795.1 Zn-ribbon domain-containing OB-fold protein [Desulfurococcales archaeon]